MYNETVHLVKFKFQNNQKLVNKYMQNFVLIRQIIIINELFKKQRLMSLK